METKTGKTTEEGQTAVLRSSDLFGLPAKYWQAPFRYDSEGAVIWDDRGERVLDVRGWGFLTGKGALGLDEGTASEAQDVLGIGIANLLTESWPNST